jgi:dihydroorotase
MIVIKNGVVIDPANNRQGEFDVLVDGAVIREVAKRGSFPGVKASETIDAAGCWVVPGLIDMHVHLREPGFEWKETIESGAKAAVLGGFSTVCCMANTRPVNDHAEITKFIIERSREAGLAEVLPVGAVSKGLQGKEMAPYSEMLKAGCVAFSDDGEPVYDAMLMRRALEWNRMLGTAILCHEEDKKLTHGGAMNESELSVRLGLGGMPGVAEELMIARDIELARAFQGKVHFCHVSTARSVELIRRAKEDGVAVSAEAAPHHLVCSEERVGDYDTQAKMSPPLRGDLDRQALLLGLKDGALDAIASDHAPHERDTKEVEFDKASFGIIGLQTSLALMLDFVEQGALTAQRLVELYTTGPARVLNLKDRASVKEGLRADITIIDPKREWTFTSESLRSLSCNSPFIGRALKGAARLVMCGGRVCVRDFNLEAE